MFFGKKNEPALDTVDSLISDLVGKVERLQQLAEDKKVEAEDIQRDIEDLSRQKNEATAEGVRATSIAEKIAALLG